MAELRIHRRGKMIWVATMALLAPIGAATTMGYFILRAPSIDRIARLAPQDAISITVFRSRLQMAIEMDAKDIIEEMKTLSGENAETELAEI